MGQRSQKSIFNNLLRCSISYPRIHNDIGYAISEFDFVVNSSSLFTDCACVFIIRIKCLELQIVSNDPSRQCFAEGKQSTPRCQTAAMFFAHWGTGSDRKPFEAMVRSIEVARLRAVLAHSIAERQLPMQVLQF